MVQMLHSTISGSSGGGNVAFPVVRYFARPDGYWEGQKFNMSKHWLLRKRIDDAYGNRVEFREPPVVEQQSVEQQKKTCEDGADGEKRQRVSGDISDGQNGFRPYVIVPECSSPRCADDLRFEDQSILASVQRAHTVEFLSRIQQVYFRDPPVAIPEFEVPCDEATFRIEMRDAAGTLSSCLDALESLARSSEDSSGSVEHSNAQHSHAEHSSAQQGPASGASNAQQAQPPDRFPKKCTGWGPLGQIGTDCPSGPLSGEVRESFASSCSSAAASCPASSCPAASGPAAGGPPASCVAASSTSTAKLHFGYNIGGGSHHTGPGRGAGYCLLNDIAISLIELKFVRRAIDRAIIIDLDVHQGDGNSLFFPPSYRLHGFGEQAFEWDWPRYKWKNREWYNNYRYEHSTNSATARNTSLPRPSDETRPSGASLPRPSEEPAQAAQEPAGPGPDHPVVSEHAHEWVTTVSMHEQDLFPWTKYPSSLDVGLDDGTEDGEYLWTLQNTLLWIDKERAKQASQREQANRRDDHVGDGHVGGGRSERTLVIYVAGADPFEGDTLGGLKITKDGLRRRDRMVLHWCRDRGLPVAVVLAGGYAKVEDVADIHFGTFRKAMELNSE